MKKTAVEWLYNELSKNNTSTDSVIEKINKGSSIWKQAKEMEKQQVDDAFEDGYQSGYKDNGISGEQYYNDTFREIEKL